MLTWQSYRSTRVPEGGEISRPSRYRLRLIGGKKQIAAFQDVLFPSLLSGITTVSKDIKVLRYLNTKTKLVYILLVGLLCGAAWKETVMKKYMSLAIAVALLPGILSAQPRRGIPPGPERVGNISRVIADCESRTNEFKRSLRAALDRSSLNNTNREDELNRDANRLEQAMNRVRESWNLEHDPSRTRRPVGDAIAAGQSINRTMIRRRLDPEVQRQWDIVRGELNRLAEAFELPKIRW